MIVHARRRDGRTCLAVEYVVVPRSYLGPVAQTGCFRSEIIESRYIFCELKIMNSYDWTTYAFSVIVKSAPEREEKLRRFWEKYNIRFEEVDGKSGIVLNANKDRVQFAKKDFQIMWLLSFSLWKSIELHITDILDYCVGDKIFSADNKIDEAYENYRLEYVQRISAVNRLLCMNEADLKYWPQDIPKPVICRNELTSNQDKVVFDLVTMATAALFLHELKHVKFHADHADGNARPESQAEEELHCDVWARNWLTTGLAKFADKESHEYRTVYSKRSMALLLVCEYLRLADQQSRKIINIHYPPLEERIEALSGALSLPIEDNYWILSACILLAEMNRQGKDLPVLDKKSPKEITEKLTRCLKP